MIDMNEIELTKVKTNGYIPFTKPMITIFNSGNNGRVSDRGDEIRIFMYLVNYLNLVLDIKEKSNEEVTDLTIHITYKQFCDMLKHRPIPGTKVKVNNLLDVIEMINSISRILNLNDMKAIDSGLPLSQSIFVYSKIEIELKDDKDLSSAIYNITYNPYFIEFYKTIRGGEEKYYKLYIDVMLSLSTRAQQIVYAYVSRYNNQLLAYGGTNEILIDDLKFFLDPKTTRINGEWQYKMTTSNLINVVNSALETINDIIKVKNGNYNTNNPLYIIEWIKIDENAQQGSHKSKYVKFRILPEKSKLTIESVIQDYDRITKGIIKEYLALAKDLGRPISAKSLKTILEDVLQGNKELIRAALGDCLEVESISIRTALDKI